jgi:hypothetical protein
MMDAFAFLCAGVGLVVIASGFGLCLSFGLLWLWNRIMEPVPSPTILPEYPRYSEGLIGLVNELNASYRSKCKRLRTDGPTPCLCCEGECMG